MFAVSQFNINPDFLCVLHGPYGPMWFSFGEQHYELYVICMIMFRSETMDPKSNL